MCARKAAVNLIVPKHSRVFFHRCLHSIMRGKLNYTLLLFLNFGPRLLDQVLCYLNCGVQNRSLGHFGHIQGNGHVRLILPYPSSLPCHSCKHGETLQEISCCIYISDSAVISTIYISVASSMVHEACFVHSRGCLSINLADTIPVLTRSWCSISGNVRTNAFVHNGGFPLQAAMNWSCCSLRKPAAFAASQWT